MPWTRTGLGRSHRPTRSLHLQAENPPVTTERGRRWPSGSRATRGPVSDMRRHLQTSVRYIISQVLFQLPSEMRYLLHQSNFRNSGTGSGRGSPTTAPGCSARAPGLLLRSGPALWSGSPEKPTQDPSAHVCPGRPGPAGGTTAGQLPLGTWLRTLGRRAQRPRGASEGTGSQRSAGSLLHPPPCFWLWVQEGGLRMLGERRQEPRFFLLSPPFSCTPRWQQQGRPGL